MQRPSASVRSADERALSTSCLATFTCSVAELPPEPELASRLRRILVDDGIEHVDARPSRSIRLSTGGALLLGAGTDDQLDLGGEVELAAAFGRAFAGARLF